MDVNKQLTSMRLLTIFRSIQVAFCLGGVCLPKREVPTYWGVCLGGVCLEGVSA